MEVDGWLGQVPLVLRDVRSGWQLQSFDGCSEPVTRAQSAKFHVGKFPLGDMGGLAPHFASPVNTVQMLPRIRYCKFGKNGKDQLILTVSLFQPCCRHMLSVPSHWAR